MSRFDMLGSWMQGSQLGTSQYGQLAGMAQNEAALRQRQAEEAAQQEQFAARQALDQQQFGESQRMNTATLDRWGQQAAWENEDRAREAALREQEQQQLAGLRDLYRAKVQGVYGGGMPAGADLTMGPPATPGTFSPMDGLSEEGKYVMSMIDHADGNTLKAMSPFLDDAKKHRTLKRAIEYMRGDEMRIGPQSHLIGDPQWRSLYETALAMEDPERAFGVLVRSLEDQQKAKAMQDEYDQRIRLAREVAAFKAQHGSSAPTINQRLSAAKTMMAQAEKEYRGLTGQAGKTGPLVEPSKSIRDSADRFAGGTGDWFKTDATQQRHVQAVAAWDKYQQALADYDSVVSGMYQQAAGLLDGPQGQQQGADPEAIYQQIKAEMPNATEEQMAAELTRRMQGG